jgi:uncharacterized membrane protein YidH (DUF202 family)
MRKLVWRSALLLALPAALCIWALPFFVAWRNAAWAFEHTSLIILVVFGPTLVALACFFYAFNRPGTRIQRWALEMPGLFVAFFVVALAVIGFRSFNRLVAAPEKQFKAVQAKVTAQMLPALARLASAPLIDGESAPARPCILAICVLNSSNEPNLSGLKLAPDRWWHTLCAQLGRSPHEVGNFPSFEVKTIAVFAHDYRPTGERFKVDDGEVPEYVDFARVFLFDAQSLKCIYRGKLIRGKSATTPHKRLGGGVEYISERNGEPIEPYIPDNAFPSGR